MTIDNNLTPPTEPNLEDYCRNIVKAILSGIPLVGGPVNELFGFLIKPSIEKRKDKWMADVSQAILEHENRIKSLEDLINKDSFIDVAIEATKFAIATSQEEIRSALKNAVLNSAINESEDLAKEKLFLQLLSTFTDWHIKFVKLFADPKKVIQNNQVFFNYSNTVTLLSFIQVIFPQLRHQNDFIEAIWNDISNKNLFQSPLIFGSHPIDHFKINMLTITEFGKEFLKFIDVP
jgi:hypothetical protein